MHDFLPQEIFRNPAFAKQRDDVPENMRVTAASIFRQHAFETDIICQQELCGKPFADDPESQVRPFPVGDEASGGETARSRGEFLAEIIQLNVNALFQKCPDVNPVRRHIGMTDHDPSARDTVTEQQIADFQAVGGPRIDMDLNGKTGFLLGERCRDQRFPFPFRQNPAGSDFADDARPDTGVFHPVPDLRDQTLRQPFRRQGSGLGRMGVGPPISKLDDDMAMYHFVSGYTSKLAGTERGITEPVTTFSTLFGAPFFPLDASVYATMLGEKLKKTGAKVYLVNTGWCGGKAGTVPRMKLKYTRAMVTAALNGTLENVKYHLDPIFNVNVPESCPDVPSEILDPRNVWTDKAAYEASAHELAKKFNENFKKYTSMPENIVNAGPKA